MSVHPEGHAGFATAFRQGLAQGHLPPGLTARAPDEAARRFGVYRNNVMHGLIEALRTRFPAVERLVGAEFFAAMAPVFIAAHPPQSPVMQLYGGAFPEFLEGFPPLAALPYLGDVARIELARGRAYHAADMAGIDPAALAASPDPAALRLGLHPSVQILSLAHPAGRIWAAQQPDGPPAPKPGDWGPDQVMIARVGWEVPVRLLSPQEAGFLLALQAGHPLGTAVPEGFDPAPLLGHLLAAELIVTCEVE
ncbi:HvfC/BufC N-terminal domain-containing protein [Phaeovulum sp. W22_SRMD_FR3]|uniref:HvfC/BufC N-terminal domain-containing protein n=1 Tax=Phaeovulum sp. W22_SRMD_FR3 TaxID=3240274 RepID=UPI003F9E5DF9